MTDVDPPRARQMAPRTEPRPSTGRTTFRVCVAVVGAAALVIGGVFLWSGLRLRSKCFEAEVAEVLDVTVEVGTPGLHRATLKQIAAFTCRQYIRMEPKLSDGEDAEGQLRGLELTVRVLDSAGVERMAGKFPPRVMGRPGGGSVTIADSAPMPIGDYSVFIDVVKPAPSLAGRPVRFVSGYVLCGIAWMGPTIGIVGGGAGVVTGLCTGGALWLTRRRSATPTVVGSTVA